MKVCVTGLGYVGLTLSMAMADAGIKVVGVDTNKETIKSLNNGTSTIHEKEIPPLLKKYLGTNFVAKESIPDDEFDAFIICVGTPLNSQKIPVIDHVISASEEVSSRLKQNNLVILRSTIPVGTTRKTVKPILEKKSGLKAGIDFELIFAPERTLEGIAISELKKNPQIIGSFSDTGIKKASNLFNFLTKTIVSVSNLETAEMIKLIDNSYRDVHFAYSNELAIICEILNLDAHECIKKANYQYPRNNISVPSPGVGGPCLSKDPIILSHSSNQFGYKPNLITQSRWLNEYIPSYLASKILRKLKDLNKDIDKAKIFVIGFAFKGNPETADIRNSSTLILVAELKKHFSNIFGYDSVASSTEIEREGVKVTNIEKGFENADCVIIMNNNKSYLSLDIENLLNTTTKPCLFMDCWNLFRDIANKNENVVYTGVGID